MWSRSGPGLERAAGEDLAALPGRALRAAKARREATRRLRSALRLAAVKGFFRFLLRRGYLLFDPTADVELPQIEKRLPRVDPDRGRGAPDRGRTRGASRSLLRDRAILEILYATGMRASELVCLRPEDVDTEERVLRIVMGKGGKGRNVPLTRAAASALAIKA